jgi:hypothetical protein
MNPEVIIAIGIDSGACVQNAVKMTGRNYEFHILPFAGHGHQNKYVEGLVEILIKHYT